MKRWRMVSTRVTAAPAVSAKKATGAARFVELRPWPVMRRAPSGLAGPVEGDVRAALGAPVHVVDLFDGGHKGLAVGGIALRLVLGCELGCLPKDVVEVRVLLEVLGFEVVMPDDGELALHDLGLLFLDANEAGAGVLRGEGLVI